MALPRPDNEYNRDNEAETRRQIEEELSRRVSKDEIQQFTASKPVVLVDETTGSLYRLKVDSGVLSIVAYP